LTIPASRVFSAWTNLTEPERGEVIQLIIEYQKADTQAAREEIALEHITESQRSFVKSSNAINFGPAPGSCPTCGR
jgi:hypothetical protein